MVVAQPVSALPRHFHLHMPLPPMGVLSKLRWPLCLAALRHYTANPPACHPPPTHPPHMTAGCYCERRAAAGGACAAELRRACHAACATAHARRPAAGEEGRGAREGLAATGQAEAVHASALHCCRCCRCPAQCTPSRCAPIEPLHCLPSLLLQESKGKFDLKEPYYRQQMQWMMQMAAAAPTAAADAGAATAAAAESPAVEAAAAAMGVPQHLMDTN